MNRGSRKQQRNAIVALLLIAAIFAAAQLETMVQTVNGLYAFQHQEMTAGETDPSLRAWLYEDNGADSVMFYCDGYSVGSYSGVEMMNRLRNWHVMRFVLMTSLLVLILTACLVPRRRFIQELAQEASRWWSPYLTVRLQHRRDGEKEAGYNFVSIA